ncbi:hybrid sensor histidine kinase/response regulator [Parasulfitobacter algicola]|uniref:histidine kinase n=1 Tax=Parasulfitobacter algicola TaxID=2614809 RepID=A0ABX2IKD4_9RHOB|nr:PAS-domain containing protein [Sulfitobacter algicola]NSX53313.1 PAS-domain containing protein [Sulfitobacter algicola]
MSIVNPSDSLERQNEKLMQIASALMRRVEQNTDDSGVAYAQFERAALLEDQVRQRTLDLERTLDLLHDSNARLAEAMAEAEAARSNLTDAIETVNEGFALFGPDDLLILSNSRFCQHMHDIAEKLHSGLPFDDYVTLVSESRYLALPDNETPQDWANRRMKRHQDNRVMFNVRLIWDRWLQISEHRTNNGGTVILQTDVTDIMRLEREERNKLRDKQSRMIRATLDHLNQGVCIFDSDAQMVGWNSKLGDLLPVPLARFRLGAQFEMLLAQLKEDITFEAGFGPEKLLTWVNRKSGRYPISFQVNRSTNVILDVFAQEMPDQGFVISFTDVTAEREAARALFEVNELLEQRVMERTLELEDALSAAERANASKSRFVAAASHDLLQPLSAAKLFVSSLTASSRSESDLSTIAKAESALCSIEQIIDALLDISKLEAGHASFDIGAVALSDILMPLKNELEPMAAQKGLDLRFVHTDITVKSDASFLRRIVQNLVSNAIRYTETGKVLVGVRRNGGSARLEVWDTGCGIAEKDQDVIFEEFKRLDARASASEGMGLGLAIVERACSRLGHPLGLWSELGRGTGFFVNLSMTHSKNNSQTDLSEKPRASALEDAGLIVLLVENDPELSRAMSLLLEKWNVSVLDVRDGPTALTLLEEIQLKPDALILDYQLTDDMDGVALYQLMHARYGTIPTRIISANRTAALRQLCAKSGLKLLSKPIDPSDLRNFLENAARSQSG